jgi:hypothetical protein
MFIDTKDRVACASANSGVALDGAGQMSRRDLQAFLLIGELSRRPAMNSSYASGSLLYRSRDFGTADGKRLCE